MGGVISPVQQSNANNLLYFADPMCSWCWGFTPVIDAINREFSGRLNLTLVMGGLRPYTNEAMSEQSREEILHHWREVHKRSGQAFEFDGALPDGFIYDTEPASRAVVTVAGLLPEKTLDYYKSVQQAFYEQQQDVTQQPVLSELALNIGIEQHLFTENFVSQRTKEITKAHFAKSQLLGVGGFPTLLLNAAQKYHFICHGYREFDDVRSALDKYLA